MRSTTFSNNNFTLVLSSTAWNGKKNFIIKSHGFEEGKVHEELDNCHHLRKSKNKKPFTIIRSKSLLFRASVYANRGNIQNKKKQKVKLLLIKRRAKIINYALIGTEPVPEVEFAFADANGC